MDSESCRDILVAAFCNDPFYVWLFPDTGSRQNFLQQVVHQSAIAAENSGECIASNSGCLHLLSGQNPIRLSTKQILRLTPVWLQLLVRPRKLLATLRALRWMETTHAAYSKTHMYIPLLAVRKSARGTGAGSDLLTQAENIAHKQGLGIYLETTNPQNTSWYEKRGYTQRACHSISGGPAIWVYTLDS